MVLDAVRARDGASNVIDGCPGIIDDDAFFDASDVLGDDDDRG